MSTSGVTNLSGVSAVHAPQISIEIMVLTVLAARERECDNQVRRMLGGMQLKNKQLAANAQAQANITALKSQFPSGAKGDAKLDGNTDAFKNGLTDAQKLELSGAAANANTEPDKRIAQNEEIVRKWPDSPQKTATLERCALARMALNVGFSTNTGHQDINSLIKGDISFDGLETLDVKLKAESDAIGQETAIDQIGLQSWIGKLNNIITLLSTMVKKFEEMVAGIINKT